MWLLFTVFEVSVKLPTPAVHTMFDLYSNIPIVSFLHFTFLLTNLSSLSHDLQNSFHRQTVSRTKQKMKACYQNRFSPTMKKAHF